MVLDAEHRSRPGCKANGFGGIDRARFEKALDQIGLTFTYKKKPKTEDVFDDRFLPLRPSAR